MNVLKNVKLVGDAVLFGVIGNRNLYKIDLCVIASGGDWRIVACYDPARGTWYPTELLRQRDGNLMDAVTHYALTQHRQAYAEWILVLSEFGASAEPEHERITNLVEAIVQRFSVTRKDISAVLAINPATLREYCEGKASGKLGPLLVLALDNLLTAPKFEKQA